MSPPIVQRHAAEFADRNLFLQMALGLVSYARQLDAVLARHVPAPDERAERSPAHPSVEALLGVVALRHRLGALLATLDDNPPAPPREVEAPRRRLRWLR